MMFIIKDWAGYKMDWGEFETLDDAFDSILSHVYDECAYDNVDPDDDETFSSYLDEYYIDEVIL